MLNNQCYHKEQSKTKTKSCQCLIHKPLPVYNVIMLLHIKSIEYYNKLTNQDIDQEYSN
jgi:hypothetical protein